MNSTEKRNINYAVDIVAYRKITIEKEHQVKNTNSYKALKQSEIIIIFYIYNLNMLDLNMLHAKYTK